MGAYGSAVSPSARRQGPGTSGITSTEYAVPVKHFGIFGSPIDGHMTSRFFKCEVYTSDTNELTGSITKTGEIVRENGYTVLAGLQKYRREHLGEARKEGDCSHYLRNLVLGTKRERAEIVDVVLDWASRNGFVASYNGERTDIKIVSDDCDKMTKDRALKGKLQRFVQSGTVDIVLNAIVSEIWGVRTAHGGISLLRESLVNNLDEREYCRGNGKKIVQRLIDENVLKLVKNADCMRLTKQGNAFVSGMIDMVHDVKQFEGMTIAFEELQDMAGRRVGEKYSQVGALLLDPALSRIGMKVE